MWDGWAVTATLLVFLGWGVSLAVTTTGYALTTSADTSMTNLAGSERR
ncbi:hypothetical protein KBX71_03690 [Micromonospora sp. D93]|nr:hypothetical protein [Micromonospora sp. D93]MBQ1016964.1 hypothetical protein [Micromonospora sp. D93]